MSDQDSGHERRIKSLEDRVTGLQVNHATLNTTLEHLDNTVKSLSESVKVFTETMNKVKGAHWMAVSIGGAVGAMFVMFGKVLLGL